MVHRIRKEETRSAVVYGCCSDGYSFSFFRMDKDSQVRLFLTLANTYIYINCLIGLFLELRGPRFETQLTY